MVEHTDRQGPNAVLKVEALVAFVNVTLLRHGRMGRLFKTVTRPGPWESRRTVESGSSTGAVSDERKESSPSI